MSDEKVHLHWHDHSVTRDKRQQLNGHKGCVIWFTGLSAAARAPWPIWSITSCTPWAYTALCSTATMCGTALTPHPPDSKSDMAKNLQSGLGLAFRRKIARRTSAASVRWPSCLRRRALSL